MVMKLKEGVVSEGTVSEVITFQREITNERFETIYASEKVRVSGSFYWDSHGKLVPWEGSNGKKSFWKKDAKVTITKHSYTEWGHDWENWTVEVNGKEINGSVYSFNYDETSLRLKIVVGWG